MTREVCTEIDVLRVDGVLTNVRQKEDEAGCEEGEGARNEEGVAACSDFVVPRGFLEGVERVGAGKGADFAGCCCDAVVLASSGLLVLGCVE